MGERPPTKTPPDMLTPAGPAGTTPRPARRRLPRLAGWILIALAILAVTVGQILERGGDGMPSLPGVLFDPFAALVLLTLCASLGVVLAGRWIAESDVGSGLWLGICAAFGAAVLSLSLLALGLLGLLHSWSIAALLAVWSVIASRAAPRVLRAVRASLLDVWRQASQLDLRAVPALLALVLLPFLLYALLPPTDWDSLMYHLDIPAEWMSASRIYLPPDNYHFVYVGLLQMLYLPFLAAGALSAPAILNLGFAILLGLSTFGLAARWVTPRTAFFSLIALASTTSVLLVASTARIDVTLALLLVLACAALEASIESPASWSWPIVSGILLGCAVGVKFSALAFVPGVLLAYLWSRWRAERQPRRLLLHTCAVCVLMGLLALPWLLKNARFVGPPLYPMASERMAEPWIAEAYGTTEVPPEVDPDVFAQLGQARQRVNLVDVFLHPERITIEGEGRWYFPSLLLLALPGLLLLPRPSTVNRMVLGSSVFLAIALGLRSAMNLRYLIPAVPGLAIGAGHVLAELTTRLTRPAFRHRAVMALVVLCLVPGMYAGAARLDGETVTMLYLVGARSDMDVLTAEASSLEGLGSLLDRINERLPSDARLLMLFEARDLYLRPGTLQDNRLTNWPMLAARLPSDACLSRTGITHVLLNQAALDYYTHRGLDPDVLGWQAFDRFRQECLVEIEANPTHVLFEVRPAESPGEGG